MSQIKDLIEIGRNHKCTLAPILLVLFTLSSATFMLEHGTPLIVNSIDEKTQEGYIQEGVIKDFLELIAPIIIFFIILAIAFVLYIGCKFILLMLTQIN